MKNCKAYIRDTKDFLAKLNDIKSLPNNAILITMDVASLYINIDHNEGANDCYTMLEKRKNKKIPSTLLKRFILRLVLKLNIFRCNEQLYKQVKGTAMGTPMAVNYANISLDRSENDMSSVNTYVCSIVPLATVAKDAAILIFKVPSCFFIAHGPISNHVEMTIQLTMYIVK